MGFDTIDVTAAADYGICVAYPGDYCVDEVAEHAIALLFASARKITRLDRAVREGKWSSFEKREIRKILPPMFRIKGQTLGLVGLGRIGRATAVRARGLGLKVIAFDPYLPQDVFQETGVTSVTLPDLLKQSDFVVIQATFSQGAEHLIGMEQFKQMKPTSYIINTARGAFIDQKALVTALREGYIAGAALDVIEEEPGGIEADHPLLAMDNVIITAHSAYYSEESSVRYIRRIYEAIASIMAGTWPEWLANPAVKENFQKRWGNLTTR
jgi:D-3-phosphoglycerate dehydrogenase